MKSSVDRRGFFIKANKKLRKTIFLYVLLGLGWNMLPAQFSLYLIGDAGKYATLEENPALQSQWYTSHSKRKWLSFALVWLSCMCCIQYASAQTTYTWAPDDPATNISWSLLDNWEVGMGATTPTELPEDDDIVIFNNGDDCIINELNAYASVMNCTNYTGEITLPAGNTLRIYSSFILGAGEDEFICDGTLVMNDGSSISQIDGTTRPFKPSTGTVRFNGSVFASGNLHFHTLRLGAYESQNDWEIADELHCADLYFQGNSFKYRIQTGNLYVTENVYCQNGTIAQVLASSKAHGQVILNGIGTQTINGSAVERRSPIPNLVIDKETGKVQIDGNVTVQFSFNYLEDPGNPDCIEYVDSDALMIFNDLENFIVMGDDPHLDNLLLYSGSGSDLYFWFQSPEFTVEESLELKSFTGTGTQPIRLYGDQINVKGDIEINSLASNYAEGTIVPNASSTSEGALTLELNGENGIQTITGTTTPSLGSLPKLSINNLAGVQITNTVTCTYGLEFKNGKIYSGTFGTSSYPSGTPTDLIVLDRIGNTSLIGATGAGQGRFIDGAAMRRNVGADYIPVGKGDDYRPINLITSSGSCDGPSIEFTAEYFQGDPNGFYGSTVEIGLGDVSDCEFWVVTNDPALDCFNTNPLMTLNWDADVCAIGEVFCDIKVARYDNSHSEWVSMGGANITGDAATTGTVSTQNELAVDEFGVFAIAVEATETFQTQLTPCPGLGGMSSLSETLTALELNCAGPYDFIIQEEDPVTHAILSTTIVTSDDHLLTPGEYCGALEYEKQYVIEVEATIEGSATPATSSCTLTTPAWPLTSLLPPLGSSVCYHDNTALDQQLETSLVPCADRYYFSFTNVTDGSQLFRYSGDNFIALEDLNCGDVKFGGEYTVTVQSEINGILSPAGDVCTVKIGDHPLTQLAPEFCNYELFKKDDLITAVEVPCAANYIFEITKDADPDTNLDGIIDSDEESAAKDIYASALPYFKLSYLNDNFFSYATSYTIKVQTQIGQQVSDFGAPCKISTALQVEVTLDQLDCTDETSLQGVLY